MVSFGRYAGRAHVRTVLACSLLAVLACYLLKEARDPKAPPRVDESEWVTAGYVAFKLVRALAPPARWERAFEERDLKDWGNKNPPIGKLVIGAAVAPLVTSDAAVRYHASIMASPEQYRLPPTQVLVAARTSIALCAVLLLLTTYLLANELLGGSVWASVAPLCLFFVPNFQWHATHVYTDIPELAFMSFGAYALLKHVRTQRFRWFALALLSGGLACAVKFSAAVFCVATAVYASCSLWRRRPDVVPFLAAAILPIAAFVAVNPFLYDRPIDKSIQLVRDWHAIKRAQRSHPLLASAAVHGVDDRFELVLLRGGFSPLSVPHIHTAITQAASERIPEVLGASAVIAVLLAFAGVRLRFAVSPHRAAFLGCGLLGGVLLESALAHELTCYGGLCGVGVAALLLEMGGPDAAVARTFALVLATNLCMTALWLPFDWARYFLPNVTLVSAVYALGAASIARCFTPHIHPVASTVATCRSQASAYRVDATASMPARSSSFE